MIKRLIYAFLLSKRFETVDKTAAFIANATSEEWITQYQLNRFNTVWEDAWKNIPFYEEWKRNYNLPDAIKNLSELKCWPILTKDDLRNPKLLKRNDAPDPGKCILTGGSTGVPVRLPVWPDTESAISKLVGKSWYGLGPTDRVFLLWGHLHLYGKGLKRSINIWKRRIKDWLAGWTRVSAYDLSRSAMENAYKKMVACKPELVIGYSPSILTLCRINQQHSGELKSVKAVLCSSGPLSRKEKEEISAFFNARVCMEYGSVECGVMAYTHPSDDQYHVFWHTHLVQAVEAKNGEYKNIVTLLSRKYIPLIRYDIGDYLSVDKTKLDVEESVLLIRDVVGRPSEFINFANGVSFFGWAIGDCVKQCDKVINHQLVVDEANNRIIIRVVSLSPLGEEDCSLIRRRIATVVKNTELLTIDFEYVDEIPLAPSGKTIRVIRV